ncbi:MAG TPA: hypothetical protein VGL99_19685 [Chloroflexota bacterium]|jgi:hypothetical protein
MELALTLISIASFFALVLAWIVLPSTDAADKPAIQPLTSPQIAS